MLSLNLLATATAALLATSASAQFNPQSKTNVAVYWGQGPSQLRLIEHCKRPAVDIINVGFVNQFPGSGQSGDELPGSNFGNACWADTYTNRAGNPSKLLSQCPNIGPDIIACQTTYKKKIFLSLGGAAPTNQYLPSDASGRDFADFLWGAFGPQNSSWTGPRPFGNAVVDGFDFDIESSIPTPLPAGVPSDYRTKGYVAMVNYFKNTLYPKDSSKSYYLSLAPQCQVPDSHFANVMNNAWFDFAFIQFYNTPRCSARTGINKSKGIGPNDMSFDRWQNVQATKNPNIKLFIGLPGAPGAATSGDYLNPAEAQSIIKRFFSRSKFGGVMVWEATFDYKNTVCGRPFGGIMKDILNAVAKGTTVNTSKCGGTIAKRRISRAERWLGMIGGGGGVEEEEA